MFYFPRSTGRNYEDYDSTACINQYNKIRQMNNKQPKNSYPMDNDILFNNQPLNGQPLDNQPLNNRRPMDNNQPLNNRRPMDNDQPLNNGRPMDNNQPLNNRRPMDNNQPLNNRRPMDNNQPLNNRRPMDINQPSNNLRPINDYNEQINDNIPMDYYVDDYDPSEIREALVFIKNAVEGEKEDELFYNDLIGLAPDQEQKDIIASIRDDEIKHNSFFSEIYEELTGEVVKPLVDVPYEKPTSYIDGIEKALFGELGAVERYRMIYNAMPNKYFRDLLFEVITDELKHGSKYNYLYTINYK